MTPELKITLKEIRTTIRKQQHLAMSLHSSSASPHYITGLMEGYNHALQIIDTEIAKS